MAAASTRQSVLARARDGDWIDFLRIYPPLIQAFARRRGLGAADAEDVVQQTLTDVVRRLPEFEYDQTPPAHASESRRHVVSEVPPEERVKHFQEAAIGLTEVEAMEECCRCLRCDIRNGNG